MHAQAFPGLLSPAVAYAFKRRGKHAENAPETPACGIMPSLFRPLKEMPSMWFRNLTLLRLPKDVLPESEEITAALDSLAFRPTLPQEPASEGFGSVLGGDMPRLHVTDGNLLISLRREERLLPSSVVNDMLAEKIEQIETAESRKVGSREKRGLRDEITLTLLPRAFTRRQRTWAYLDPRAGWMVIDTAAPKRASAVTDALRKALGSLPVQPLRVQEAPTAVMTRWLLESPSPAFVLDESCELREPEGGQVVVRRQGLEDAELRSLAEAGRQVTRLALIWRDKVEFTLCDDLTLRGVRFTDTLTETLEADEDDPAARLDAEFALMSLTFRELFDELIEALGGEATA